MSVSRRVSLDLLGFLFFFGLFFVVLVVRDQGVVDRIVGGDIGAWRGSADLDQPVGDPALGGDGGKFGAHSGGVVTMAMSSSSEPKPSGTSQTHSSCVCMTIG